jgi:hypothetical protein
MVLHIYFGITVVPEELDSEFRAKCWHGFIEKTVDESINRRHELVATG